MAETDDRSCCVAEALALGELEAGAVSRQALDDLGAALGISRELARVGIGAEAAPTLAAAAGLLRLMEPGPVALTGANLAALREAIDVVQHQRRLASRAEFAGAALVVAAAQQRGRRL